MTAINVVCFAVGILVGVSLSHFALGFKYKDDGYDDN